MSMAENTSSSPRCLLPQLASARPPRPIRGSSYYRKAPAVPRVFVTPRMFRRFLGGPTLGNSEGIFEQRIDSAAISCFQPSVALAQQLRTLALVGKRSLHPWVTIDRALDAPRRGFARCNVGNEERNVHAPHF